MATVTAATPGTGARAAPTPTTSASADRTSAATDAQDRLEQGLIAYNPPQEATQDEEFDVVVRLQRGTTATSSALISVPGPGSPTIATIPVGAFMTAALDGPGFVTRLVGPARLPLALDETAEFSWVVAPKAPGSHTLTLTLVAEVQGQPARQRTYQRSINVNVLPEPGFPERIIRWSGWSDTLSGALAAGLVAGVTWLIAWRRRQVKGLENPSPHAQVSVAGGTPGVGPPPDASESERSGPEGAESRPPPRS